MNITRLRVTDTNGVEHEWEGSGWLYLYTATTVTSDAPTQSNRIVSCSLSQPLEPDSGRVEINTGRDRCEPEFGIHVDPHRGCFLR